MRQRLLFSFLVQKPSGQHEAILGTQCLQRLTGPGRGTDSSGSVGRQHRGEGLERAWIRPMRDVGNRTAISNSKILLLRRDVGYVDAEDAHDLCYRGRFH